MKENAVNRIRAFAGDLAADRKRLIRIMLIILMILTALVLRIHENNKSDITIEDKTSSSEEICVDIGGAVVQPGVYTVGPDTRLYEVIEMAGGLLSNADTDSINRAEYVEDGEKIMIPSRTGVQQYTPDGESSEPSSASSGEGTADETASSSASALVNINTASKEELKKLSGIGDVKAEKIIEYRLNNRFRSKEDIKMVEGIGDATYNSIKDLITV